MLFSLLMCILETNDRILLREGRGVGVLSTWEYFCGTTVFQLYSELGILCNALFIRFK